MEEQSQQAIRNWTLAQPIVSAYVAAVVRDFRDRDDVLQAIKTLAAAGAQRPEPISALRQMSSFI
jgi:hypothetical protein